MYAGCLVVVFQITIPPLRPLRWIPIRSFGDIFFAHTQHLDAVPEFVFGQYSSVAVNSRRG